MKNFKDYCSPDRAEALENLWEKLENEKIPAIRRQLNGGGQILILDKNPYKENAEPIMSIVLHDYSYGHDADLFETAFLKTDGSGDAYEIEGWQSPEEVMERVRKIRKGVHLLWKA